MTHLHLVPVNVPSDDDDVVVTMLETELEVLTAELIGRRNQAQRAREAISNLRTHATAIADGDPEQATGVRYACDLIEATLGPIGIALPAPGRRS